MAAEDRYKTFAATAGGPSGTAFAITPSDSADVPYVTNGIYVGGAGDLSAVMADNGDTVVFKAVPAGSILPIRVTRVKAAGTTATNMVGMG